MQIWTVYNSRLKYFNFEWSGTDVFLMLDVSGRGGGGMACDDKATFWCPCAGVPSLRQCRPLRIACQPRAAFLWRRRVRCRTSWGSPGCWTGCLPGRIPAWRGWSLGRTPPSTSRRSTGPTWPRRHCVRWCHLCGKKKDMEGSLTYLVHSV